MVAFGSGTEQLWSVDRDCDGFNTFGIPSGLFFFSVILYGIEPATFLFVNLVANDLVLFCKEHGTKPPTVVTPQPQ